jgi:hypothetical protein
LKLFGAKRIRRGSAPRQGAGHDRAAARSYFVADNIDVVEGFNLAVDPF